MDAQVHAQTSVLSVVAVAAVVAVLSTRFWRIERS